VGFILNNTLVLAYSTYLHYVIFSKQVQSIQALQLRTIAALGPMLHSAKIRTTWELYWSVILDDVFEGMLFLICSMIGIVTIGFLIGHLWMLSTGTTTNESFKWSDIKDALLSGEILILDQDDPFMYHLHAHPPTHSCFEGSLLMVDRVNRVSRIVPLLPPTEEDEVETPAEEACRLGLAAQTSRGTRTWGQVQNIYSRYSRWKNIVDGIRGGKVYPAWSSKRKWFKRKD
jgi:hypothetical protein